MFLKINPSTHNYSPKALRKEREPPAENVESPLPPTEPTTSDQGSEELKKILAHPGCPIETPVPLRPVYKKQREVQRTPHPTRPLNPLPPLVLEPKICRNARSTDSPIYWTCIQVVFDLVPTEWFYYPVDTWEKYLPDCEEPLKINLLEFVKESELGSNTLKRLATIGLNNLKNVVKTCSKESLPLLAKKEPFDVQEIIRINVERIPTLNTKTFVAKLYSLIVLLNKAIPSWDGLISHTNFLKQISDYPTTKYKYSIHQSDKIYLFIKQLQMSHLESPFLTNRESRSKINTSGAFLDHLNEISSIIGERLYQKLIENIKYYISESEEDERPSEVAKYQRDLWLGCGEALFGALPFFKDLPLFKEVCSTLKSLPLLTAHSKAVELINKTHFQGKSEVLSIMLYKSWWFCAYLRDLPNSVSDPESVGVSDPHTTRHSLAIPHSLADRLVDWYMHQLLEDPREWEMGKAVQLVKFLFQKNHPHFPFNASRAERVFFALKLDLTSN